MKDTYFPQSAVSGNTYVPPTSGVINPYWRLSSEQDIEMLAMAEQYYSPVYCVTELKSSKCQSIWEWVHANNIYYCLPASYVARYLCSYICTIANKPAMYKKLTWISSISGRSSCNSSWEWYGKPFNWSTEGYHNLWALAKTLAVLQEHNRSI